MVRCGGDEALATRAFDAGGEPTDSGAGADSDGGVRRSCTTIPGIRDSSVPPNTNPRFRKLVLTSEHYAESAAFGDFDCDGTGDVVAGPLWYRGPDFTAAYPIYDKVAFDPHTWSDNFVAFVRDFSGDGRDDVLVTHGAGRAASWYENPGSYDGRWTRHVVVDVVDNESPAFTDLTGDGLPELVYHVGGRLGWGAPDWLHAAAPWVFHALSPALGLPSATHGLGVGDVDGDGRRDVVLATGYWRQPASLASDPVWEHGAQAFGQGGAQIYVYDVDGNGASDVITSLAAHGWGLSWFEQVVATGAPAFVEHSIVAPVPTDAGVVLYQPHALALHDIDGDGLEDIVTGERFWGHVPEGDADFSEPARLYWFKLRRDAAGARYEARLIDDASGVGTQIAVGDVTGDGSVDIAVSTKKGAFLFVGETGVAD